MNKTDDQQEETNEPKMWKTKKQSNDNPQTPLQPAVKNTKNPRNSSTDNREGGAKTPSREKDVEDTPVPKHPTEEKKRREVPQLGSTSIT